MQSMSIDADRPSPITLQRWTLCRGRAVAVRSLPSALTVITVSYLVFVPLLMLLYASVKSTEDKLPFESTATTLANYAAVFTSPATLPIFLNTLLFTAGSLGGWTAGGDSPGLAGGTDRHSGARVDRQFDSRADDDAVAAVGDRMDPIARSAHRSGQRRLPRHIRIAIRHGPFDIYTLSGMCFVQGLRLVPSAYLMIAASFRAMDPSLEEQSAMAGQNVAQTTLRVTLPIMRPALLAALIYFIIVVIESFDIPGLLGFTARIRVLSTAIYWATHSEVGLPDYGLASALGAIILVAALVLMWGYQRLTAHQERFATVTGKGYRPRQIESRSMDGAGNGVLRGLHFDRGGVAVSRCCSGRSVQPFYAPPSAESLARRHA